MSYHCPRMIRGLLLGLVAAVFGMLATTGFAGDLRYEWPEVHGAAGYEGSYTLRGETTEFRTVSRWLMLEPGTILHVNAVDAQGHVLMSFTASSPAAVLPVPPPPPPAAIKAPDATALEPAPSDEDVTSDVLLHGDEQKGAAAQPHPQRRRVYAGLALGHEAIKAAGGVTDFAAAAAVAGGMLGGEWQGSGKFWYVGGRAEVHRLHISEQVLTADGTGNTTSVSTFQRVLATAGTFYDLNRGINPRDRRIALGAGIEYLRMPMLVAEGGANEAHFHQQNVLGPFFGLDLRWPAGDEALLYAAIDLVPLAFTPVVKTLSIHAQSAWERQLSGAWTGLVAVDVERLFLARQGNCPAVNTCADQTTANSTVLLLSLGLGYHF